MAKSLSTMSRLTDRIPRWSLIATIVAAIGTIVSIVLPNQEHVVVHTMRIAFGSVFVLFVPGWFIVSAAFSQEEIDLLERIALSFALSISALPLLIFYLNLAGMKITVWSVFSVACLIVIASIAAILFRKTPTEQSSHA